MVVTITATRYGSLSQIVENLPAGFAYVLSSLQAETMAEGQTVTFTLAGDETFTYTVITPAQEGAYCLVEVLHDWEGAEQPVGGYSTITVRDTPQSSPELY